ncbi:MAG: hypothetical protein ABFS56_27850 [Pseudomonadota bacterium]
MMKFESLELQNNQLSGEIPSELGKLRYKLRYVQLQNNELSGDAAYIKLDNNHLTATDQELIDWLNEHNPDWETTQRFPKPQLNPTFIEDTLEGKSQHILTLVLLISLGKEHV